MDSCPAENSAWWVTAAAVPEAAHSAVELVWVAVEDLAVVAGPEKEVEVEEAPERGTQGQRVSAGCRECVRAFQTAPDWETEDGMQAEGRRWGQRHQSGR